MKTLKNNIKQNVSLAQNQLVSVPRSTYFIKYGKRIDFDMGLLVPVGKPIEVIAGDTFSYTVSAVTKLLSPQIKPVLDTLKQDIYAFFVPNRIVENDWEKIFTGHTDTTQWDDETKEVVSTVKVPSTLFPQHSVASYMDLPINKTNTIPENKPNMLAKTISALSFRAYAMIWNWFFRDENLMEAIHVDKSNTVIDGAYKLTNDIYDSDNSCINGGNLLPTCKTHDLFTSALPAPQKGSAVTLPLGDTAEVVNDLDYSKIDTTENKHIFQLLASATPAAGGGDNFTNFQVQVDGLEAEYNTTGYDSTSQSYLSGQYNQNAAVNNPANFLQWGQNKIDGISKNNIGLIGIQPTGAWFKTYNQNGTDKAESYESFVTKPVELYHNLKVDLAKATAITINDLRYAFQLQLIKEADARNGTRYNEYLLSHFGLLIGNAYIQQPEFLGMISFNLNSTTVTQTSASDEQTPQGNLSSYTQSGTVKHIFTKSFIENGIVMFLTTVRQKYQVYTQKIDKFWDKKTRFDFFHPELKNIGEQPIKNEEIFFDETNENKNKEVFGYQEAWYEYHYEPTTVTNKCSPYTNNNLSIYSYAEKYLQTPTLSPDFLKANDEALKNTLAIPPQNDMKAFISDFYFINKATREVPKHCIPGLIDHSGKIII